MITYLLWKTSNCRLFRIKYDTEINAKINQRIISVRNHENCCDIKIKIYGQSWCNTPYTNAAAKQNIIKLYYIVTFNFLYFEKCYALKLLILYNKTEKCIAMFLGKTSHRSLLKRKIIYQACISNFYIVLHFSEKHNKKNFDFRSWIGYFLYIVFN